MMSLDEVRAKSAKKLSDPGMHPVVRAAAEALIDRAYARGVAIVIYEGYRSIAYQDSLYAKGRTAPGPKVTDARGGRSYHNFGLAIDFALLAPDGRQVLWDTVRDGDADGRRDWAEVVEEAQRLGFEWGVTLSGGTVDHPHLQMTFGLTTAQLRAGARPSPSAVAAASARIESTKGKGDEPMTKEERAAFEQLQALVKTQSQMIEKLSDRLKSVEEQQIMDDPPAWASDAVKAAVKAGLIDTPAGGSLTFYRLLTVLHRAGKLTK